jgi:vesicle coat complex subunit
MGKMKLVRTGENEYRIEGLDRGTLEDVAKILIQVVKDARKKGYGGFRFDPFLELIATSKIERMRIKKEKPEVSPEQRYLNEIKRKIRTCIKDLKEDYSLARYHAVDTLGKIGPDAKAAVPAIIRALKDDHALVRSGATEALAEIDPGNRDVVLALIEALEDKEPQVRGAAAEALSMIGPPAKNAVPALVKSLGDKHVRGRAALALWKIGYRNPVPALIMALEDEFASVRGEAAEILGNIAEVDDEAASLALTRALVDKQPWVREKATEALKKIDKTKSLKLE